MAQDFVQALRWYQRGAKAGDPVAYLRRGVMYQSGEAVKQDLKEARRWYLLAAEAELPQAMYLLGRH